MSSSPVSAGIGMLAFLAAGVILSAAYDVLRIWRAMFRSGKRAVLIQDFLYMCLAACASFLVCLGVCFGELRLYLFCCEALGWALWHETAGRVTVPLFRKLFRFLYAHLFDPLSAQMHKAAARAEKILRRAVKSVQKWRRNRKKVLKPCRSLVYNYYINGRKRRKPPRRGKRAPENMKVIEGKKKKNRKSFLLRIAIFVFSAYICLLLIQQQATIREKKEKLASVERQIQIQEIRADDLADAVGSGDSDYYEQAARESLDYSKPGERVYVNIAGK